MKRYGASDLLLMLLSGDGPPAAPTGLAVTGASGGTVADLTPEATWDAVPGALYYEVEIATTGNLTGTPDDTPVATTSYTFAEQANLTDYDIGVRAVNAAGPGPWATVTVQTEVLAFHDPFPTPQSAPVPDPLNGVWDVHDTGNKLTVVPPLSMSSSTGTGNPQIVVNSNKKTILENIGDCLGFRWRTGGGRNIVGIANNTNASAGSSILQSPSMDLNNIGNMNIGGRSIFVVPFAQDNTWYWAFMTRRTSGYEFRIYGGAYTSPFLVATIPNQTTLPGAATQVPIIQAISTAADFDHSNVVIANLPAPFDTDTGAADEYQASSTADDEIAMATNAQVEWQFTAQTGVTRKLYVRYIDATHYIAVVCNQGASTLAIVKNEGSGESTLNSVAWTWTDATLYRVMAFVNGAVANAMASTGAEWATTSNPIATTFVAPENGGIIAKVSHDGGVFASWPLVRADIKAVFDKLIAATA